MFLKVVSIIDIILGIILMIFNPDQILTLFIAICASVAMIYFADMCRDISKIRSEIEQLRRTLAPTEAEHDRDIQQRALDELEKKRSADAPYDGVNRPGPRYEAVLKAERNKQ